MNNEQITRDNIKADNVIILKSVYGKVGMKYFIQPVKDPKTGRYPSCVKKVNSQGDMILTDAERNSGEYFVKENDTFIIEDGKTFNLDDEYERKQWEAIKNCSFIAPDKYAKDSSGDLLIGVKNWNTTTPRNGVAELYVYRPGQEMNTKISRKKKIFNASSYIYDDPRGYDGRLLIAKLLGKNMTNMPDADVTDFLLSVAESEPDKIVSLYTEPDTNLRLLFIEAMEKHIIYVKNKLFIYADNIVLGATDDAVITWMKDARNKKILELIKRDVYPDLYVIDDAPKSTTKKAK